MALRFGWSVAYETLAASIARLVPRRTATGRISGGPRASPFGSCAWLPHIGRLALRADQRLGRRAVRGRAQELTGAAAGTPVTYGVSFLGFDKSRSA